jgi:pimeloyl-ACP methyl ester carboxylesterase
MAPLRAGLGTPTLRADKKGEAEMFKSTVVVTSSSPPFDAAELRTPTNIQLHEEVFVHYLTSTMNSPTSLTGENAQSRAPTPQPSAQFASKKAGGSGHQGSVQHEQDHDCCPFTAIRRSELSLRTIMGVRRTSPFDWSHLFSSFSVKNAFMFYPPPPTYGFFRDEDGTIQVRSQTGKRAPRLDHERVEYLRRKCRLSDKVPDDLVAGALHGIAFANQQDQHGGDSGNAEGDSEPSFKLIFIPWENDVQSYYIRSGAVVFGPRVRVGLPLYRFAWPCPIPCSIIRPHRRMSSHVAIFFHCNGEDVGRPSCLRLLALANALHMTILVPEYPGYGLFEGSPSEASIKGAMERVIEFLFTSDPSLTPSRLILMGHSIGTGVAIHIAKFIVQILLKLRDCVDLNNQTPYACPMSRCHHNPANYAATVQCPRSSFVTQFSPVPATSPTAQIPCARSPKVSSLPLFTPLNAPLSSRPVSADSGDGGQRGTDDRADSADTRAGLNSPRTPLRAPYGKSGDANKAKGPKAAPPTLCPHYALGGVILLAPFASLRCVERVKTLKGYGFNLKELERRRLAVPEDILIPAPEDWAEDAHELCDTGVEPPELNFMRPSPLLFDIASHVSFNRFPTIDVMREMQDEVGFFTHTPLLLLHGAQDMLIPAINSVAIASKLRQAKGGRTAKVYLGFLRNEGHNNLRCSHITRRFYKDVILMPHLRAQQGLREELEETLRNGLGKGNSTAANVHNSSKNNSISFDKPASPGPVDSTSTSVKTASYPVCKTSVNTDSGGNGGGDRVEGSADPHAFDSPYLIPLSYPTSGTNRTTEPFDDEPLELTASHSTTRHSSGDEAAAGAATMAAETEAPPPLAPSPAGTQQSAEPYLYFIEPAYAEEGATWLANGNFAGPVRIRLLHPPSQCGLVTDYSPEASNAHQSGPHDSNLFVVRPVDPARGHDCHHHHRVRRQDRDCDASAVPQRQSSPMLRARHQRSSTYPCGMQLCHASEQFEDSLRYTLHRTQPPNANFAPAATMLHIALFHHLDHYDVGSIAVASITKYSLDATVALSLWRRHRRNHFILRCVITFLYFACGFFLISLAICHGVLTHPSLLRRYVPSGMPTKRYHRDVRVIIWGVLDGFGYLLLGIARFYNTRLGLGNLSKFVDTPISVLAVYATCRVLAYVLCGGAGLFMAMIIALTPPDRGGVDWERWSDLPYTRRVWISYLPRWTMVTSASIHIFFLAAVFLKNH